MSLLRPDALALPMAARLPGGAGGYAAAGRQDITHLWQRAVFAVVLAALTFNCFLAFVNTRITGVSASHVMLVEVVLIGIAAVLALNRHAGFYVLLLVYLAYMALILALRPELDLKAIRDALIPIVFYFVGRGITDIKVVDRLVLLSAGIVIAIGLFEYFLLDTFIANINILDYYIARGTVEEGENFNEGSSLFISGVRPEGRNFLPFLGQHRVSSVFLEPVSMGNYGAFLFMWGLFRQDMARRTLLFAASAAVIILGDARFGMFVCLAFVGTLAVYRFVPRVVWWLLPAMFIVMLVLYGTSTTQLTWEDNLAGRWFQSSRLFLELDLAGLFGISADEVFLGDSGYGYTLQQIGMVGVAALWSLFIFARVRSSDAWRLRAMVVTYICLLMVVSNSLYSIKTAALLWVCVGAADVWQGFGARRAKDAGGDTSPAEADRQDAGACAGDQRPVTSR